MKKIPDIRRLPAVLLLATLLLTAAWRPVNDYFEIARNLEIFASLFKEVNTFYVEELDPEKTIRAGIEAMLRSLDPYTTYIPAEDKEAYRTMTTGEYGGIGAYISEIDGRIFISMPNAGFPAHKAGLQIGDEIIRIDDTDIAGLSTSGVSELLKGRPGTTVKVTVKRQDQTLSFELRREKIVIDNVPYAGILKEGIGYIELDEFTTHAADEVKQALLELKKQGATGIILDLRNNPGGILQEAVDICNLFIPKGQVVVETRGKTPNWNKVYKTVRNPVDDTIPLVVLINENSASAAEIVSGTLQDYDRAVLIGSRTFGKGLVQTTRPVGYDSQVKITVARYYTPSGRCIQAIDYAHRQADGSAGKIPDSLRVAFTTANGRTVYDGGGIAPDVEVASDYLAPVSVSLLFGGHIFHFATRYYYEHPEKPDPVNFTVSDELFDRFAEWMQGREPEYESEAEQALQEFEASLQEWSGYSSVQPQVEALKQALAHNLQRDMQANKEEIKDLLATEIIGRYYLEKGKIAYSVQRDPEVARAVALLRDTARYRQLLQPAQPDP